MAGSLLALAAFQLRALRAQRVQTASAIFNIALARFSLVDRRVHTWTTVELVTALTTGQHIIAGIAIERVIV